MFLEAGRHPRPGRPRPGPRRGSVVAMDRLHLAGCHGGPRRPRRKSGPPRPGAAVAQHSRARPLARRAPETRSVAPRGRPPASFRGRASPRIAGDWPARNRGGCWAGSRSRDARWPAGPRRIARAGTVLVPGRRGARRPGAPARWPGEARRSPRPPCPGRTGAPEIVVGLGVAGMRIPRACDTRRWPRRPCPGLAGPAPRLSCAIARLGSTAMALRNSAMPSSAWPRS